MWVRILAILLMRGQSVVFSKVVSTEISMRFSFSPGVPLNLHPLSGYFFRKGGVVFYEDYCGLVRQ
jgi:hypothetical protein